MSKFLIGLGAVLVVLAGWVMGTYNGMINQDENANQMWANVESSYQRRFDLIDNLVQTVQGSAEFEQETLTAVTAARSAWATAKNSGDPAQFDQAGSAFDSAVSRLLVTVEAYPDIKSTEAFLKLQDELAGTENRIKYARDEYNTAVKSYNITVRSFPANILAGMFNFSPRTPFESQAGAENAPDVNFDFNFGGNNTSTSTSTATTTTTTTAE